MILFYVSCVGTTKKYGLLGRTKHTDKIIITSKRFNKESILSTYIYPVIFPSVRPNRDKQNFSPAKCRRDLLIRRIRCDIKSPAGVVSARVSDERIIRPGHFGGRNLISRVNENFIVLARGSGTHESACVYEGPTSRTASVPCTRIPQL